MSACHNSIYHSPTRSKPSNLVQLGGVICQSDGFEKNTPYNMGNMRIAICTTNALEISRCDLQHGFCWVLQSILTLHTYFCGNNLLHCSFWVGKGKGHTRDPCFVENNFFSPKGQGDTHDPCFLEYNFFFQ
jgi:hypothetical protein